MPPEVFWGKKKKRSFLATQERLIQGYYSYMVWFRANSKPKTTIITKNEQPPKKEIVFTLFNLTNTIMNDIINIININLFFIAGKHSNMTYREPKRMKT